MTRNEERPDETRARAIETSVRSHHPAWADAIGAVRVGRTCGGGRLIVVDADGRAIAATNSFSPEAAAYGLVRAHHCREAFDRVAAAVRDDVSRRMPDVRIDHVALAEHDVRDGVDGEDTTWLICADMLNATLRRREATFHWRPRGDRREALAIMATERRRTAALGDSTRLAALRCCPVLARHVEGIRPYNAVALIREALEMHTDASSMMHFVDGRLVDRLHLTAGDGFAYEGPWSWKDGELSIPNDLPAAAVAALQGRPIGDLIAHSALPDARITSITRKGGRLRVATDARTLPLRDVAAGACRRALDARMTDVEEEGRAGLEAFLAEMEAAA